MKLIKWKDIHWDIVRSYSSKPWVILGWPITVHTTTDRALLRFNKDPFNGFRRYLQIRIPFTPKITWTWDGELRLETKMYPVVSHNSLRFYWNGFLWFWRDDE